MTRRTHTLLKDILLITIVIMVIVIVASSQSHGQQSNQRDSGVLLWGGTQGASSGTVQSFIDLAGSLTNNFEIVASGTAAATLTTTVVGCMPGGTCSATLTSSVGVASQLMTPSTSSGPFQTYKVTLSWTGGDATTAFRINRIGVMAKLSGVGSGTITNSGNLANNNFVLGAGALSIKDYGSSIIAPVNGGTAPLSVADQGYMIPAILANFTVSPASFAIVPAANQVRAIQFVLPTAITVRRVTWITVATAGDTVDFGIYSGDGATKLAESGATVSVGASAAQQVSITAVVLPAGTYFFAYTQTGTPSTTFACLAQISVTGITYGTLLNSDAVKKMGTAANSATAGVLPASLGVITASSAFPVPVVLFEP